MISKRAIVKKRQTEWTGYKVHLTETCDARTPNLITQVETTPAATADAVMTAVIEEDLAHKKLLPSTHLVDTSYVAADQLVRSQQDHGVDLLGPLTPDSSWQAQAQDGFDISHFVIDWALQTAPCQQGRTSIYWKEGQAPNQHRVIHIHFAKEDCLACPVRACCTHSSTQPRFLQV
jgi:transposase